MAPAESMSLDFGLFVRDCRQGCGRPAGREPSKHSPRPVAGNAFAGPGERKEQAMWIVGVILLLAAGGCVVGHAAKKRRDTAMATTETATVEHLEELARSMREGVGAGSLSYAAEVKGRVECTQPLVSELAAAECIHYRMRVQRQYEEKKPATTVQLPQ